VVVVGYGAAKERTPEESTYELANPVGGKRAFKQYLENNMQYPPEAVLNNVEGRVTVTFEVESSGSLRDFKVIKGIGSGCDEEVIRLIQAGPKWTPTKKDEVAEKSLIKVRMRFQLPRKKKK
jgi:TonB family protein